MNQTDAMARAARAKKVTWVGFWVNVVLSVAKIIAGIVGRSGAMIADGVHSLSDLMSDIVVLVFIRISSKARDREHEFNIGFRYRHHSNCVYRSLGKRREHPLPLWTRQV